jgi:hypothetical protein
LSFEGVGRGVLRVRTACGQSSCVKRDAAHSAPGGR